MNTLQSEIEKCPELKDMLKLHKVESQKKRTKNKKRSGSINRKLTSFMLDDFKQIKGSHPNDFTKLEVKEWIENPSGDNLSNGKYGKDDLESLFKSFGKTPGKRKISLGDV